MVNGLSTSAVFESASVFFIGGSSGQFLDTWTTYARINNPADQSILSTTNTRAGIFTNGYMADSCYDLQTGIAPITNPLAAGPGLLQIITNYFQS